MELEYFKTDRNGTKYYYDWTCPRCGGAGGADNWSDTGWTCYACGGTGVRREPKIVKEYTPEYQKVLDERARQRYQRKNEELEAQLPEKQVAFLADQGFTEDGYTYIFLGDTYSIKDKLKVAGALYDSCLGWHIDHEIPGYQFLKVHIDEVATPDYYKGYYIGGEKVANIKERLREEYNKLNQLGNSEYVGTIGQKVSLELTYTHIGHFDTQFGTTYVYEFTDDTGNVFVWQTSSWTNDDWSTNEYKPFMEIGDKVLVTGTIKAHTTYKGVKQTVLTRCKINKL